MNLTWLSNGELEVGMARDIGPRVAAMRSAESGNVFAELGSLGIEWPDLPKFTFYGGHRLWVAPEVPEVTYTPDDEPVAVDASEQHIAALASHGPFEKAIRLTVDGAEFRVDHRIVNRTDAPARLAPWAITQLRPGGIATLPLGDSAGGTGLQANRSLVAWPYTEWDDPLIELKPNAVRLLPGRSSPTKVGARIGSNPISYELDGWRFEKRSESASGEFVDLGATGQIYASTEFVELETLGPLVRLAPGEATEHTEWWALHQI